MDAHTRTTSALVAAITLAASLLTLAPTGNAADSVERDHQGRTIHFNVKAPNVDKAGYAEILSNAAHGDEIDDVTITVTNDAEISNRCGSFAEACFLWTHDTSPTNRSEIILPAWSAKDVEEVLLHEYAHHLDASSVVQPGARAFDGTPLWFAARNMGAHTRNGQVGWMYSKGWDRTIGEIFAEDYVVLHMGDDARHRIDWLGSPRQAVLSALAADFGRTIAAIRGTAAAARNATTGDVSFTAAASKTTKKRTYKGLARRKRSRVLRLFTRKRTQKVVITGRLRGPKKGKATIRLRCGARTMAVVKRSARGKFRIKRTVPVGPCKIIVSARKGAVRYAVTVRAR